jgi:hypothetical protein
VGQFICLQRKEQGRGRSELRRVVVEGNVLTSEDSVVLLPLFVFEDLETAMTLVMLGRMV